MFSQIIKDSLFKQLCLSLRKIFVFFGIAGKNKSSAEACCFVASPCFIFLMILLGQASNKGGKDKARPLEQLKDAKLELGNCLRKKNQLMRQRYDKYRDGHAGPYYLYIYMYTHIYIYGAQIKNIDVVSYKNRNWRNKLYVEFFVCF